MTLKQVKQVKQDRRFIERLSLWLLKEDLKWAFTKGLTWFRLKTRIPFTHRKVKTLFVHSGEKSSQIKYGYLFHGTFKSKDGEVAKGIVVNLDSKAWQMEFTHELAHVLTLHTLDSDEYIYNFRKSLRAEVIAWRLAKSFCKKQYWKEATAIESLINYTEPFPSIVDVEKLRKIGIVSLNKNIRIPHLNT